MPPHPLLPRCDIINRKFGQERSFIVHHVQRVIKGLKKLLLEVLRQIFWLLITGFTNFEILILVLASLLLKLRQKRPGCAYLVTERLKWYQNETKLICQIQFVVERSKPDLYGLLELRIPHLKFPFTFDFHLSITISAWAHPFSSQFWLDDVTRLSQNFEILRERFHKGIIHLKVPFTFDFHLSINIGTWNTNLDLFDPFFWVDDVTAESQNFIILR